MRRPEPDAASSADPYVAYTRRFFARWLPFYDFFARPIAFVYQAAVRRAQPGPGRRVLDLATGTGEMALRCARAGAEVTAVDLTFGMLARAAAKVGPRRRPRFVAADARRLPLRDGRVEVALLSFALHDMPRKAQLQVLAEAARVARERLVVLDYRPLPGRGWWGLWRRLIALFETAYFPAFARRGAAPLLAEAGLEAAEIRGFGPLPFAVYSVPLGGLR